MRAIPDGHRTQYSPRTATGADYIGSRREALDAELAHEEGPPAFHGFGDLDDFDSAPVRPARPAPAPVNAKPIASGIAPQSADAECPKCHGRGSVLIGYSAPRHARCFRCDGTGRVSARSAAGSKARETTARNRAAWREQHADVLAYLQAGAARGWEVATGLLDKVEAYGSLHADTLAKVRGWMQAAKDRAEARSAERAAAAPAVDGGIKAALDTAAASGLKRPKLRLDGFVFALAPATGRNAGAVYVTQREDGDSLYLGKVVDGRFHASRECPAELTPAVVAAASSPAEAAVAAGRALGVCACCGRELSDPDSIARGIGPICAERFGF